MNKVLYNAAVRVGDKVVDGETKGRYINIGAVLENDEKRPFMLLDKTFNPAGVVNDNRPNVLVSLFPYKPRDGVNQTHEDDDALPF